MWVRSLCKHYDNVEVREEGEEFEHSGPLYEHIAPAKPADPELEPPQKDEPASREQKPARKR